jgi:hypothetical protein
VSEKTRPGSDGDTPSSDLDRLAWLAKVTRPVAPSGFADRVMNAVGSSPAPVRGFFERIALFFTLTLPGSRIPGLTGVLALAAFALLIAAIASRPGVEKSSGTAPDYVLHEFELVAPQADKVCLVGDFNDWKLCEAPLQKNEATGAWTLRIAVPPGRHEYMFVVDDESWVTDPNAPVRVEDGFGNQNAVVFL